MIDTFDTSASEANPRENLQSDPVLTISEVVVILRCSKAHVCNLLNGAVAHASPLTHVSLGRRKLVRRDWLDQWMEENKSR